MRFPPPAGTQDANARIVPVPCADDGACRRSDGGATERADFSVLRSGSPFVNVHSVIVCYHPDVRGLLQLCRTLLRSRSAVVLVDNSENRDLRDPVQLPGCTWIPVGENAGVARAQNIGIRHALGRGAGVIVLFDQDSEIDDAFLPSLLSPLEIGIPKVVAPVFHDATQGYEFPSFRLTRGGYPVKVYKAGRTLPYDVDVVTSSGSAATAATFAIAGFMEEDFFIDLVDTEWCLRCRSKNIPIQVVPAASMKHTVGQASVDYGLVRGFIHNPTRCYYQIRNALLLFRKAHVPFLFALREALSEMLHKALLVATAEDRRAYIRNCSRAIGHGLRGIGGKQRS